MNKPVEYKLISNAYTSSLSIEVTQHLEQGWCLYDQPYCYNSIHYQAVVKYG